MFCYSRTKRSSFSHYAICRRLDITVVLVAVMHKLQNAVESFPNKLKLFVREQFRNVHNSLLFPELCLLVQAEVWVVSNALRFCQWCLLKQICTIQKWKWMNEILYSTAKGQMPLWVSWAEPKKMKGASNFVFNMQCISIFFMQVIINLWARKYWKTNIEAIKVSWTVGCDAFLERLIPWNKSFHQDSLNEKMWQLSETRASLWPLKKMEWIKSRVHAVYRKPEILLLIALKKWYDDTRV